MPLLTETKWKVRYSYEDGDLEERFYNPVLACAVEYCRTTGYFIADWALCDRDRRQKTEDRSQNVAQPENPVAAQFS
jgi:hypothetical protein